MLENYTIDTNSVIKELRAHPLPPLYTTGTEIDEHWRERRAIVACLECAGIRGEEASIIEYKALRKLGLIEKHPCE